MVNLGALQAATQTAQAATAVYVTGQQERTRALVYALAGVAVGLALASLRRR